MLDLTTILSFGLAALALLVIPGPAVLYIVAQSLQQGRKAGLVSVLGVQTGGLTHVLAAALGLSALVFSSALLFSAVKFVGAAYLIYLGFKTLLARHVETHLEVASPPALPNAPRSLWRVYWRGAVVNALNPKTGLFFLAFLPQFIHPQRGSVALQTVLLGVLFLSLATITDGTYALLAGTLGQRLRHSGPFLRKQRFLTGGIYLALGVGAATANHH